MKAPPGSQRATHGAQAAAPAAPAAPAYRERQAATLASALGNQAMQSAASRRLQPRLEVGPGGGPDEREAESFAGTAAGAASSASPPCAKPAACGCTSCAVEVGDRHDSTERAAVLAERRLANPSFASPRARLPPSGMGGEPVPSSARDRVAAATGVDLDGPRLRTGPDAQAHAAALDTRAFAFGGSIFLGAGTPADDVRVLAHEAAHLAQDPAGSEPVIHRYEPDEELAWDGPIGLIQLGWGTLPAAGGIVGPIPTSESPKEDHDLLIEQPDPQHATISFGDAQISIRAHPEDAYAYYVEPLALPEEYRAPDLGLGSFQLVYAPVGPPPQRVVRIAATWGVSVDTPYYFEDERPELVAHVRWVSSPELVAPMTEMIHGPEVREVPLGTGGVLLQLDWSWLKIEPVPQSEGPIRPLYEPFSDPRYAYWIDPRWTGPERKHKVVHVVASPGIRVQQFRPEERMIHPGLGDYGRELDPTIVRVPHSSMVPEQGERFDVNELVGTTPIIPFQDEGSPLLLGLGSTEPPEMLATVTPSGAVAIEHTSGAIITIRPTDPDAGAAFAWEALPNEGEGTQIRIVVGPGVRIEVDEPIPVGTQRGAFGEVETLDVNLGVVRLRHGTGLTSHGIYLEIIEVPDPAQVPRQGTPLNIDHFYTLGWARQPDEYRWAEQLSSLAETQMDVTMTAFSFVPIAGDLKDIAEFVYGLATGKDFLGRELSTGEKIVMGIGAVIGLIPVVGDLIGKGLRTAVRGANALVDVARAARSVGTTPERLEVILMRLRGAVRGEDADVVNRVSAALRRGDDVPVDDLERLRGVLRRVGTSDSMLAGSPWGRGGLVVIGEADEAARLGRRAPELDDWYRGLNDETRAMLQADPDLARAYERMDPVARRLVTRCGSACIPRPPPDQALQHRIKAFATNANIQQGTFQERQVRAYLQRRRGHLDEAIGALKRRAGDPQALNRFLGAQRPADVVLLNRPRLVNDPAVRQAVNEAVAEGVDLERLANVVDNVGHLNTPRVIGYVRELDRLRRAGIAGTDVVMDSLAAGGNWARGAEWVLRYLDETGQWAKVKGFEELLPTSLGDRVIDVIIGKDRYQLKTWDRFIGSTFVRQIAKDFELAGGPSGFFWVFEARRGLPDQAGVIAAAEAALRAAGPRSGLNAAELRSLIAALPTIIRVQ